MRMRQNCLCITSLAGIPPGKRSQGVMSDPISPPAGIFAQFLGLTMNSWGFPHHSGYLCNPKVNQTTSAHTENWTRRRFARRSQRGFHFLQKTPENSQLKLKVTSQRTKQTQQPHLLPPGMEPWGPWRSPPGWEAFREPKHGDNSKRQTLCNIFH